MSTVTPSLWQCNGSEFTPVVASTARPAEGDYALSGGRLYRFYAYRYGRIVGNDGRRLAAQMPIRDVAAIGRVLTHFAAQGG